MTANNMIETTHPRTDKSQAGNSVFIKLWLDVKPSDINLYFAFVVN